MRARHSKGVRGLMVTVAALAIAGATVTPAHADDFSYGVNIGISGTVAGHHEEVNVSANSALSIDGGCTFAAYITPPLPTSSYVVEFGGFVHADGTGGTTATTPIFTDVTCTITNVPAGGSNTMSLSIRTNGATSAVAGSTLLATDGPKEWPQLPVTVCVQGDAHYGPFEPATVTLAESCQPLNIPVS